jgi:pSer/pThr/pTyr-binding forkhead associated (FHA) protein
MPLKGLVTMYSITVTERGKQPERIELDKPEIVLGRAYGNDIILARSSVSKRHVRIVVTEDRFVVDDLQSTHGTSISGHKISIPTEVKSGDTIVVGDFRVLLKHEGAGVPRPSVSEYVIGPPISPSGNMPSLTGSHAQVMPRDIETGSHLPATGFGKEVTTTRITSVHSALAEGIAVGASSLAASGKVTLATPSSSSSVESERLGMEAQGRRARIRIERQPAVFGPLRRPEGAAFAEIFAAALNGALLRVNLADLPLTYPTRQEDVLRFSPLVAKAVDLATPADFDSGERAALAPLLLAELLGLGPLELLLGTCRPRGRSSSAKPTTGCSRPRSGSAVRRPRCSPSGGSPSRPRWAPAGLPASFSMASLPLSRAARRAPRAAPPRSCGLRAASAMFARPSAQVTPTRSSRGFGERCSSVPTWLSRRPTARLPPPSSTACSATAATGS